MEREKKENRPAVSRRALLAAAGGAALGFTAGRIPLPAAWSEMPARDQAKPSLITLVSRPYDAETPVSAFTTWLTPSEQFFVRSHFGPPPPERVDPKTWRLRVSGLVDRNLSLSLEDLQAMEPITITAVIQCSGNGRAFFRPRVPGAQWRKGAVGNARWTGVRVADLLRKAGARSEARHLQLLGADRPVVAKTPLFHRSVPIAKALHPDTILAYKMNDEPIPLLHGAPARFVAPGWMADACVKWVTDLTVSHEEAQGFYMQTAYRHPTGPVKPGEEIDHAGMKPVEEMVVKSLIVQPAEGSVVARGPVTVEGVAWTGEGRVAKVEVSADEGRTWESARLVGEDQPYAWRQWRFEWRPAGLGERTIICRATDDRGMTQPMTSPWNPGGYLWNGMDRVQIEVRG